MNKKVISILSCGLLCTNIGFASNLIDESTDEIITDGFVKVDKKAFEKSANEINVPLRAEAQQATKIANLGDSVVVTGQKAAHHIALIKKANGGNFILQSTLTVKCKKGIDCIPSIYEHEQLGNTQFYRVEVKDYYEWKQALSDLSNLDQVIRVSPSIDRGIKKHLR